MVTISRERMPLAWAIGLMAAALAPRPAGAQLQPAAHPHVHGVASVDVAVDASSITISMSSPLDNLIGFEHPPRTDAERSSAANAVSKLQQGAHIFAIDAQGHCVLKHVELSSSALGLGHPDPSEAGAGHADIDGTYDFACPDAQRARFIDVALFEFPHMQKVAAQVAGAQGQSASELTSSQHRIVLSHR